MIEANNIQDHVYLPKKSNINFISALLVAPIVETIILSILINMLQKSNRLKTKLPTTIGIIAAVTHGMQNFVSIFSAGWSFYMYTIFFIELEKNIGIKKSFKFSIFMHLAINMAAIAFLKLSLKISGA